MRMMRGLRLDAHVEGELERRRGADEEDDDSVRRVWMVKAMGARGKGW